MCIFDTDPMQLLKTIAFFLAFAPVVQLGAQTGNVMGDAVEQSDECYSVTLAAEWQNGAVWFLESIDLTEPFTMDLKLNFGFNDEFGADGMVFVMQTAGTDLLGEPGGGLGFGGITPSIGVEFDTFQNTDFGDLAVDHIALVSNGSVIHSAATNLAGPIQASTWAANIEDGADHLFRLVWEPSTTSLEIWFDCQLRLTHTIDLVSDIFGGTEDVFWGFTGSTGGLINTQTVCLDQFTLGLPEDVTLCAGESVQLGVNGPEDGDYTWSPAGGVSDTSIADPIFTPTATTTYEVVFSDVCGAEQTDEVTISVADVSIDIGPDQVVCDGEMAVFTADVEAGTTVTWGDGSADDSFATDTSGEVEATAELDGCVATDTASLEINALPAPDVPLPTDLEFCAGDSGILDASCAGCTYDWGDSSAATLEVVDTGVYTVMLTNAFGCQQSFSATVVSVDPPVATLPYMVQFCAGSSEVLDPGVADAYLWSTGVSTSTLTVTEAGFYDVILTSGPCTATANTDVQVTEAPDFPLPTYYSYCSDNPIQIAPVWPGLGFEFEDGSTAVSTADFEFCSVSVFDSLSNCSANYTLEFEQLFAPQLNLVEEAVFCVGTLGTVRAESWPEGTPVTWEDGETSTLLQVTEPGHFVAAVENSCGSETAEVHVFFESCSCHAYVPNAFTPDSDGTNDVFLPVLECTPDRAVFRVFNRWGQVLYETEDLNKAWTGHGGSGSHYAEPGVYVWQLQFTHSVSGTPEVVDVWGTVTLVR